MGTNSLSIVQMNDTYAYVDLHPELFWQGGRAVYRPAGGYARIAALVGQLRADSRGQLLFCDGGDALHGTYPAVSTEGAALVPILNALGLAATTAHWEFAYGPATLQRRVDELTYPLLALNVYEDRTNARCFPASTITEVAGLRIGLIGIASNIVDKTMPPAFSAGIHFTLGRDELPPVIAHLRAEERADLVVLISHLGFPQDMRLLSEVGGIDVCLSGHTHNRLDAPARQGETLVIQSGCHGSFLGHLALAVENGKIVDYRHRLLTVDASITPDPAVDALVRDALAPFREELGEIVGETATPLDRNTALEATMDNFLLHALREATGAQLAFSNGWRYGAPIVPGPITMNDLYNIIPMNPPVSTAALTGEEIIAMLEENLERTYSRDPYSQMGGYVKRYLGLTAYVKIENPPGQRIQQLFVGEDVVQPNDTYTAAFVTEQGVDPKYGHNRQQHGERGIDALRAYLARHRPLRMEMHDTIRAI